MKKLVFGLIATVVFGFVGNAQEIEQSTAIITKGRVTKEGEEEKSARSFALLNFNISNKLETEYYVDGHLYNDSGEKNDLKSGDGIYTSVDLFVNPKDTDISYLLKSDTFKYEDELAQQISVNKFTVKIGCKMRHVRSGYSILGTSCAHSVGGCIEFYGCEASFEWSW